MESRRATVSTIPVIFCLTVRSQISRGDDDDDDDDDDGGGGAEEDDTEEDAEDMAADERDADDSETTGICSPAGACFLDLEAR